MPRFLRLTLALAVLTSSASAREFPNKDMITLQAQVQQLLDAVARLQQSNDERMGVLKDLVQQNSDSVNRMSVTVDTLQKQITAQSTGQAAKTDQVSGQIQALNDSLDEMKARMVRLEKVMGEVSNQQQTLNQNIQSMPQPSASPAGAQPVTPPPANLVPPPTVTASAATPPPPAPRKPAAPLVDDMYKAALNDYMAARYNIAAGEFGDLIKAYPDSTLAGNAWYYQGEIDYRAGKFTAAAKDYDKLLEQYPDNNKIPAAHLHKGQALIELKQNDAGIRELRALIARFPNSPEATSARSKLNAMGVPVKPRV